jgi:hypothetical protein
VEAGATLTIDGKRQSIGARMIRDVKKGGVVSVALL